MKLKITQKIALKLLNRLLDVDRDNPVYMVFKGDDKVDVQKCGDSKTEYRFYKSHYKNFENF